MTRFFLILYLSLFVNVTVHAQQPFVQYHSSEVYKTTSAQNTFIRPDHKGTIYIANVEGVLRYDGTKWDMLTLPNKDRINGLTVDTLENIYVSTEAEIGYFQRNDSGKYKFHSLKHLVPARYKDQQFDLITSYKNNIFFFNKGIIFKYENKKLSVFEIENSGYVKTNRGLYVTEHGDDDLLLYRNGKFERQNFNELRKISVQWITDYGESNTMLILDSLQQLWTFDLSPGANKRLKLLPSDVSSYAKESYFTMVRSLDNGMLVLSSNKELLFMTNEGKALYLLSTSQLGDLIDSFFVFKDSQHNLWISSSDALIQMVTSSPLTYYDKHNNLQGVIIALGKLENHLYVGSSNGLFYKKSATSFKRILQGVTWSFLNKQNNLYVVNDSSVYQLKGEKLIKLISHREYAYQLCETKTDSNRLIMGADDGLWLLQKNKSKWREKKIKGYDESAFRVFEDRQGYLWVSDAQKGIYRLKLNSSMDSVISVSLYDNRNGLPSNLNNRIFRLNNGEVVATSVNGIYRYNDAKDKFEPDRKTSQVLGKNFCIYSLSESANGDLYFYGAKPQQYEITGVLKKQQDGSYKPFFTPFNKVALPIQDLRVEVDAPILIAGPEDVFFGNKLELLHYNPEQKTFYDDPIYTSIRQVWAKDSLILSDNQISPSPEIAYKNNNLKFNFSCSFYEDAEKTVYQHKLEGFENEWSDWSGSHEASYTNIPGGTYTFLVRSKNIYGTISKPASFTFDILFPWYQKWWAYILYFILLAVIVWTIIYYYTQQIRLQKKLLQRMVAEKTKDLTIKNHEILNKNEEISMQAESLENLNLTKDKLFSIISHDLRGPINQVQQMLNLLEYTYITEGDFKTVLPDLKESVRYTVSLTDNLLHWARNQMEGVKVKPSLFDIHEVVEENFRLFRPLATRKNITLVNTLENHYQVFADKDMIKLVIRNLVSNAIKFTEANGRVEMGVNIQEKFVTAYISDTGKGIPKEDVSKILNKETFTTSGTQGERGVGLGLSLCQEFIERNAGHLYIESEPGKGSKFSFTIPISAE